MGPAGSPSPVTCTKASSLPTLAASLRRWQHLEGEKEGEALRGEEEEKEEEGRRKGGGGEGGGSTWSSEARRRYSLGEARSAGGG